MSEETEALLAALDAQRSHVLGAVDGLSDADLRRPVLPSGWTCLGLVQHLALDVERFWFRASVGGEDIRGDPVAGLRHRHPGALGAPLSEEQVSALFRLPVSLREHAMWRLVHDCGAPAALILALDVDHLDLSRHRARARSGSHFDGIEWREGTSQVLRWLLAGRMQGPVFLTGRRAPAAAAAGVCRASGQARLSYRRAAEIFTALTRPLDAAGSGWTLHQLSAAGRAR